MQAEKILTSSGKFHIELGLSRISRILELLENPQKNLNFIHIAGTNGKGSTSAILEEIYTASGLKTGKFTSPHIFSYTERITINKRPISNTDFENIVNQIAELDLRHSIGLTEFEILTAAGFLYFSQNHCDIVILETGLGGRLDSTNVIEKPLASIITSISLEHTERLGNTIEKIAFEKAGIIKKGCPCVFLEDNKGINTLKSEAERLGGVPYTAKTIEIEGNYANINSKKVEFSLKGRFQGENLALALKAVEIINKNSRLGAPVDFETVKKALKNVRWKFRMEENEINGHKFLIDACHNPDGARVLREYLDENYKDKKIRFIFGCLKNKDYKSVLNNLLTGLLADKTEFYFHEFNYPNSLKYADFHTAVRDLETSTPLNEDTIRKTDNPKAEILRPGCDLTVIAGSIYMLGTIFKDF